MPLALFGTLSFGGLTLLTFLLYGALGAAFVLIPYTLIENHGMSPLLAGAALLPIPAILGGASRFMGALAARTGPRWPLTIGPLVVALGFALATRTSAHASYWTTLFPALVIVATGMAGAVAPLTTAVMASVDARHVGTANGFNSAIARTGGLIATASLGSVLAASGADLDAAFDRAVLAAAAAAALAGVAALLMLRPHEIATKSHAQ
jgi:predicted MFS family arabinose efflux permease